MNFRETVVDALGKSSLSPEKWLDSHPVVNGSTVCVSASCLRRWKRAASGGKISCLADRRWLVVKRTPSLLSPPLLGILFAIWELFVQNARHPVTSCRAALAVSAVAIRLKLPIKRAPAASTVRKVFREFKHGTIPLNNQLRQIARLARAVLDGPPTESHILWKADGWEPTRKKLRKLFGVDGLYDEATGEMLRSPEMLHAVDVGAGFFLPPRLFPTRLRLEDVLVSLKDYFLAYGVPESIRFDLGSENSWKPMWEVLSHVDVTPQFCPRKGVKLNSHVERSHRSLNSTASELSHTFDLKILKINDSRGKVLRYASAQRFRALYELAAKHHNDRPTARVKESPVNEMHLRPPCARQHYTENQIRRAFYFPLIVYPKRGVVWIGRFMYYHPELERHCEAEARVLIGDDHTEVHFYSRAGTAICSALPDQPEGVYE